MTDKIKKIIKSKYGVFILFLLVVTICGVYLYLDRPTVNGKDDIIEINGTLRQISKVLVYSNKINKTERDSTYYIYLNEYLSKFQVSYFPYDRKKFFATTNSGDSIKLHIAKKDEKYLYIPDEKIRSFSLKVNSKSYLTLDEGLSGFGKGIFELVMIFLPLTIIIILIIKTLREK